MDSHCFRYDGTDPTLVVKIYLLDVSEVVVKYVFLVCCSPHIPYANIKGEGPMNCYTARRTRAVEMFRLHLSDFNIQSAVQRILGTDVCAGPV